MEDWLIISSLVKYRQNKNQQSEHAYVKEHTSLQDFTSRKNKL